MTVEMTSDNFEALTKASGIVLVDCWAPWCRNCDEFAESFRKAANKHTKHLFVKLNAQEQKELVRSLGIEHVPSLMLFRDGLLLFNRPGSYEEATLDDIVTQAESLDMDLVSAELAPANTSSEKDSTDPAGSGR